jgi:acyl-CoA reductase-like NAD-dependent aldehyde dehydrogenase
MLLKNYNSTTNLPLGDPLDPKTMIGPLHTPGSVENYKKRLESIKSNGGELLNGTSGQVEGVESWKESQGGNWVWPTIAKPVKDDPCWKEEYVSCLLSLVISRDWADKQDLCTYRLHCRIRYPRRSHRTQQFRAPRSLFLPLHIQYPING